MEIKQALNHLTDISSIPVTYFDKTGEVFHSPKIAYLQKLSNKVPKELLESDKNANCMLTDKLLCFGIVKVLGTAFFAVFGPVSAIVCDNRRAQAILKKYNLPTTEAGELLSFFKNTPVCSLQKFSNFILFANYVINKETLPITQLLPTEYHMDEDNIPDTTVIQDIKSFHTAESYEKTMYSYIKYGKYNEMLEFIKQSPFTGNEGSLASDMLRHQKNLIISSTALASRSAVDGGLDYETAMRLADAYIQKVEMAPSAKDLAALHNSMLKNYTKQVAERKINNSNSATSSKVYNYIDLHMGDKIRVQDIAREIKISRSYLSVQFKKETGINLNDFINQIKIDEAKRLLATSDKNITQIATLLAFSSQSYFDLIFKEHTGMTPKEYRGKAPYLRF